MDFEFAQVREQAAVDSREVEAARAQLLEGVVDRAVERVVGSPQGQAVADNNEVGIVAAQELVQPADGSMAEVRPGKAYCRNTEVDMKVRGYEAWEHTSWLLRAVM